jgi:hypothetical protein
MSYFYRHTQAGLLLRWMTLPAAIGLFFAGFVAGNALLFLFPAAALGAISWAFSSLTVEVSNDDLVWYFGPGVWRKTICRSEIECAIPVRNEWWWGWGIHLTPRGWLYNVSGLDAVEIVLRNGKTLRIGSDQISQFADALNRNDPGVRGGSL